MQGEIHVVPDLHHADDDGSRWGTSWGINSSNVVPIYEVLIEAPARAEHSDRCSQIVSCLEERANAAAALVVSRMTVKAHLIKVCRNLGIRSRTQPGRIC
jgi:hypothetical protein